MVGKAPVRADGHGGLLMYPIQGATWLIDAQFTGKRAGSV